MGTFTFWYMIYFPETLTIIGLLDQRYIWIITYVDKMCCHVVRLEQLAEETSLHRYDGVSL